MIAVIIFGFVAGFLGAIPVAGPVAAMVIQRAVARRFGAALWVAIGSGVAEAIYAALAVVGFSFLVEYEWVTPVSKAVAAVILIGVGLMFALKPPTSPSDKESVDKAKGDSLLEQWFIGFGVTIVNPTLLATWGAATSMLHASGWATIDSSMGIPFGLAVGVGCTAWFVVIIALIRKYASNFTPEALNTFIRWMGWGLVGLGVFFLVRFVQYLVA